MGWDDFPNGDTRQNGTGDAVNYLFSNGASGAGDRDEGRQVSGDWPTGMQSNPSPQGRQRRPEA